jgi:deoxyhypusine synthase
MDHMTERYSIVEFVDRYYRHFVAGSLREAAESLAEFLADPQARLLVSMGGAFSTAECGVVLSEAIRAGVVHAVSATGANLEESVFYLVAADHYERVNYRNLSPDDEVALYERGLNRVTDTCIPEEQAMRYLEHAFLDHAALVAEEGRSVLPYEFYYEILGRGLLKYQQDPAECWILAAREKGMPVFTPGFEDSTLGQKMAAAVWLGKVKRSVFADGLDYNIAVMKWYHEQTVEKGYKYGFLELGGGISADAAICVVPSLHQDAGMEVPFWQHYIQLSTAVEHLGAYSGASPNEKITWGKLEKHTPRFAVHCDYTVALPLLLKYVMERVIVLRR